MPKAISIQQPTSRPFITSSAPFSITQSAKALRNELATVLAELQRIGSGGSVDEDLLDTIHMVAAIMDGMKEEPDDI